MRTVMRAFVRDALSIVAFLRVDRFDDDGRLRTYRPNDVTPFDNMMDVDS